MRVYTKEERKEIYEAYVPYKYHIRVVGLDLRKFYIYQISLGNQERGRRSCCIFFIEDVFREIIDIFYR